MRKAIKYIAVFGLCLLLVGCRDQIKEVSEKTIDVAKDAVTDEPSYDRYDLLMTKYVNDTKVYGTHVESGIYDQVVIEINGETHEYDWKSLADDRFLPVIEYSDINGDGTNEAVFITTEYVAENVLDKRCHIVNTETFEEMELPDAISFLQDNITYKVEEDNVTFRIDDKEICTVTKDTFENPEEDQKLDENKIEELLNIGTSIDYKTVDNKVHAYVMIIGNGQVLKDDVDVVFDYENENFECRLN